MKALQELTVYVSSSLRDLHSEREYLIKRVFPELKRKCFQRGILFTLVEARGAEYPELLERQLPSLIEALGARDSVFIGLYSELQGPEIVTPYSVLKYLEPELAMAMSWQTMEYRLRQMLAGDSDELILLPTVSSEAWQAIHEDDEPTAHKLFLRSLPEQRVRTGRLTVEQTGEEVKAFLHQRIDQIPPHEDLELAQHQIYFQARGDKMLNIDGHLEHLIQRATLWSTVVLAGSSGAGKSTLLAGLMKYVKASGQGMVLPYSLNAGSTDPVQIQRYIARQLARAAGTDFSDPVADENVGLLLTRIAEPVYLIIDAAERLDDLTGLLKIFPQALPRHHHVVISSSAESQIVTLQAKGWEVMEVGPLSTDAVRKLTMHLAATHGIPLRESQIELIVRHPLSFHATFLCSLFDELRQFGWFKQMHSSIDELLEGGRLEALMATTLTGGSGLSSATLADLVVMDARLEFYLSSHSFVEFYEKVLERLEYDFGVPQLMRVLTTVAQSVYGLTLEELVLLTALPRNVIEDILHATGDNVLLQGARYAMRNPQFVRSVRAKYLGKENLSRAVRRSIIEVFRSRPDRICRLEIIEQLTQLEAWEELELLLLQPDNILGLIQSEPSRLLLSYWRRTPSRDCFEKRYLDRLSEYSAILPIKRRVLLLNGLAEMLIVAGKFVTAREFLEISLAATALDLSLLPERGITLRLLGRAFYHMAMYREAEAAFQRSSEVLAETKGAENSETLESVRLLASLLAEGARYEEAEAHYLRLLDHAVRVNDTIRIGLTLNPMAFLYNARGRHAKAIDAAMKAEQLFMAEGETYAPELAWSQFALATAHRQLGATAEAIAAYQQAMQRFAATYGSDHPVTLRSVFGYATLLYRIRDLGAAQDHAYRVWQARVGTLGESHADTATSAVQLGSILRELGDLDKAERLLVAGYQVFARGVNLEHPEVARTLHELGLLYKLKGNIEQSVEYLRKAHAIRMKVLGEVHIDTIDTGRVLDELTQPIA